MLRSAAAVVTFAFAFAAAPAPSAPKRAGAELDRSHVWRVEGGDGLTLVRGKRIDEIRKDAGEIVRAINTVLNGIALQGERLAPGEAPLKIRLTGVRDGIARVEVSGGDFLSERMGTSGAWNWLAAATFTLTEIPGVNAVEFVFEEGSHAEPGVYRRAGFREFTIVRE